jgi:magnesium chelatase family protein
MPARRLATILPAMTLPEALDTTRIHRVASLTGDCTAMVIARRVAPPSHHLGCRADRRGRVPMPGEVSLAHHGTLFLDELPEFKCHVLEVLCQPLKNGIPEIQCRW